MRHQLSLTPEMARRVRNISIRQQITVSAVLRDIVSKHFDLEPEPLRNQRLKAPEPGVEIPPGVIAG